MTTIISRRHVIGVLGIGLASLPRMAGAATAAKGIYPVATGTYQVQYVAQGLNFFRDEGIDCRLIQGGSGVKTREIIASGQGDFAIADFVHPMLLTNKGRPAKALTGADTISAGLQFMLRADLFAQGIDSIPKFVAWKRPDGRKPIIGVSSIGGTSHVWATYYMEQFGFDGAVTWLGVGNVDTMLGTLKTKQIDLLVNTQSLVNEVETKGYGKMIYDGSDPVNWNKVIGGPVPVTVNYCLQSRIDRDPGLVQAWTRALLRAARWIAAHSPSETYDAVEQFVGSTSREANIVELTTMKTVLNPTGLIDPTDFERGAKVWFREMTGVTPMKLGEVYASEFIRKANETLPP